MMKGRVGLGIILLLLQVTLIGWLPAVIVAIVIVNNENTKKMLKEVKEGTDIGVQKSIVLWSDSC